MNDPGASWRTMPLTVLRLTRILDQVEKPRRPHASNGMSGLLCCPLVGPRYSLPGSHTDEENLPGYATEIFRLAPWPACVQRGWTLGIGVM